jgi:flagellar biosynthesis/type III secretory pathway protein FliH
MQIIDLQKKIEDRLESLRAERADLIREMATKDHMTYTNPAFVQGVKWGYEQGLIDGERKVRADS